MPGAVAPSLPAPAPPQSRSDAERVEPPAVNPPSIAATSMGTMSTANQAGLASKAEYRAGSKWPEETLQSIEKRLATIVGPLARVLVRKASAQASTLDELLAILTASLQSDSDRRAFMSAKSEFLAKAVTQVSVDSSDLTMSRTTLGTANPQIDARALEQANQIMARYVGPIAQVLVKRAAARARSVDELYLLLAERVEENKRARFLKECGFSGES